MKYILLSIALALTMACTEQAKLDSAAAELEDDRDGKKYKTVNIGTQTWMAENLNFEASGSLCYDNKPENCDKYGRLYDWNAAINACPKGWHLPNLAEWRILDRYIGSNSIAGEKLKAKNGWNDNEDKSGNGTDNYGFSALPGGDLYNNEFSRIGEIGCWWSSRESILGNANYRCMEYESDKFNNYNENVSFGLSVRCIKDSKNIDSFVDDRDNKTYKSVKIGEQTWMAENLNFEASGSLCYDNKQENCDKYGRLYNWETAMKSCPNGWRLPSLVEWHALEHYIEDDSKDYYTIANKLKSTMGWCNGGNGHDYYGFFAMPGGLHTSEFKYICRYGFWWSSDYANDSLAYIRSIHYDYRYSYVYLKVAKKIHNHSVRCLKEPVANSIKSFKPNMITGEKIKSKFEYTSDEIALYTILEDLYNTLWREERSSIVALKEFIKEDRYELAGDLRSNMINYEKEIENLLKLKFGAELKNGEMIIIFYKYETYSNDAFDFIYKPHSNNIFSQDLISIYDFVRTLETITME